MRAMITLTLAAAAAAQKGDGGGNGAGGSTTPCSDAGPVTVVRVSAVPTSASCVTSWEAGGTYEYPDGFDGLTSRREFCTGGGRRIVFSNGIPDTSVHQGNANNLPCEVPYRLSLPLAPTYRESITEVAQSGWIGVATNGVPLFGPGEAGGTNAVEGNNPIEVEWYGHSTLQGYFHYHHPAVPVAGAIGGAYPAADALVGYALDGFPIYGPLADPSLLDECNGRFTDPTDTSTYRCAHRAAPARRWPR